MLHDILPLRPMTDWSKLLRFEYFFRAGITPFPCEAIDNEGKPNRGGRFEEGPVHVQTTVQAAVVANNPRLPELVHEETDACRVAPIISASVSWGTFATTGSGLPAFPMWASNSRTRAGRFSLELKK